MPQNPSTGGVQALQNAVSIYTDMGRLGMAARQLRVRGAWVKDSEGMGIAAARRGPMALKTTSLWTLTLPKSSPVPQEIGEVLEREGEKEQAMTFLEQAADLFATENSNAEANKCNLKVCLWREMAFWYLRMIWMALMSDEGSDNLPDRLNRSSAQHAACPRHLLTPSLHADRANLRRAGAIPPCHRPV